MNTRILIVLLAFFVLAKAGAQNFSINFTGGDDRLVAPQDASFEIGTTFTIEAWIQATEWRAEAWQGTIVGIDGQNPDIGYAFRCGKNGTLSFVMAVNNVWTEAQTDAVMNANQWNHVAATVDGSNINLYINGNLSASTPYTGTIGQRMLPLTIGSSAGFPGRGFDGAIDEVRIWNIARSEAEINANKDAALNGTEAGLMAYFPMNEGSGLSTANIANTSLNATFTNLDETAWVGGYSIPAIDLGVTAVLSPDVLAVYERPVRPTIRISNFGSEAVANFPVEMSVNGLPVTTETFAGTIQPGESADFTFDEIFDLTQNTTNLLGFQTMDPSDANLLNNSLANRYRNPGEDKFVSVLRNEAHNFGANGQTQFRDIILPNDPSRFERLILHIEADCPTGGCDPWDQPAKLSVVTEEGEFEIARYITPFGIGCGPWTVDVTDFKSILQGPVQFKSYVQVWGPSGWLITADLEYVQGKADFPYQRLSPLWQRDYIVYGDPAISFDLDPRQVAVDAKTKQSQVRATVTGHGQGNTNNAAEFFERTHQLSVNGETFAHNLWKTDCPQNTCANQLGTWRFDRAGWCPGQEVQPFIVNTTSVATPGATTEIDYTFQAYTNFLNTGYNDGSHTEPHFRMWTYFVEMSDEPYESRTNLQTSAINITTNGDVGSPEFRTIDTEIRNNGSEDVATSTIRYFVNGDLQGEETISTNIAAGETYTHSFTSPTGFINGDENTVFVEIIAVDDADLNDNIIRAVIDENLVGTKDIDAFELTVSPNPTSNGQFRIELAEQAVGGTAYIYDLQGRQLSTMRVQSTTFQVQIPSAGTYFLILTDTQGNRVRRKVMGF